MGKVLRLVSEGDACRGACTLARRARLGPHALPRMALSRSRSWHGLGPLPPPSGPVRPAQRQPPEPNVQAVGAGVAPRCALRAVPRWLSPPCSFENLPRPCTDHGRAPRRLPMGILFVWRFERALELPRSCTSGTPRPRAHWLFIIHVRPHHATQPCTLRLNRPLLPPAGGCCERPLVRLDRALAPPRPWRISAPPSFGTFVTPRNPPLPPRHGPTP